MGAVAWESAITKDTITRCWVKSTLIKKPEDSREDFIEGTIIVDDGTDRAEVET
jgi:hypothetical protein